MRVIADVLCPKDDETEVTVEGRDFALSSLASLTSLDRMGPTAERLSNDLLTSAAHDDLRRTVFSNICQEDPTNHRNDIPQRSILQSLEVMANVAASSRNPSRLAELLSQNDHDLLLKVIMNVENANVNPRAADLSCIVINNVCVSQDIVEGLLSSSPSHYKERLLAALANAVSCGGEIHAELERNSRRCLELLRC